MKDFDAKGDRKTDDTPAINRGAWFTQNILLGTRSDMDYIAMAISKIQRNAKKLV